MENIPAETRIKLSTGVTVANFSSPHPFTFDNGQVLAACAPERAKALMLDAVEREIPAKHGVDIALRFEMSTPVLVEIMRLSNYWEIDIILVPLPVLVATKAHFDWDEEDVQRHKLRCVRVADRVTKTIYHNRFCL